MALAGFSAGEAEGLRRAMSRKRSEAALNAYGERFVDGAVGARRRPRARRARVRADRGFSGFGFPKSHAAAFGLLAYQSTWLRVHYGPEFLCALLQRAADGLLPARRARPRGAAARDRGPGPRTSTAATSSARSSCSRRSDVSPPCGSGSATSKGCARRRREAAGRRARARRAYRDLGDLASRSGVGRDGLERLAWAGACDARSGRRPRPRHRAARSSGGWGWHAAASGRAGAPHAQLALPLPLPAPPDLRPLDSWERLVADYSSTGITPRRGKRAAPRGGS